jgi:linoleate 9S-lipoxygenase
MKKMLSNFTEKFSIRSKKIKGTVVLIKKNVLDFNDFEASILDDLHELVGKKVSLKLISSVYADPANELKGKLGEKAYLEEWITTITPVIAGESSFKVTFDWDASIGFPGAFLIKNNHHSEFYLKSLALEDVPGHGRVYFDCNSWIYPDKYYHDKGRVFFVNKAYLPSDTPAPLRAYRAEELLQLRGNGEGERQESDRVYDYDVYNDLGDPDKGEKYVRPILGASAEYPYPRRGRTGRPPSKTG